MLNFHFLEKGLGIVLPPHFVYDFQFLMLYSLTDQIYATRFEPTTN